jgi:hypothetical protein
LTTIFHDPNLISISDEERSEFEERWVTMSLDETGVILVVSHKFENVSKQVAPVRIISARTRLRKNNQNMKKEYDFSKVVRGKFYNPDGEFNLPTYINLRLPNFLKTSD